MTTSGDRASDGRGGRLSPPGTFEPGERQARVPVSLPVQIDRGAETPLPVQIANAIREAVDGGVLRPLETVQATREFARQLGVSRGVVVAAYEQLVAEGYLVSGHGVGTFVHPDIELLRATRRSGAAGGAAGADADTGAGTTVDADTNAGADGGGRSGRSGPLAPGVPIADAVDRPAWRAAWRSAAARAHLAAPELGDPGLRAEIAEHLRRMRGTHRPAEDVIVTAGAREGLGLVLTALGTTRGRALAVGVEDPGYPSLRGVAARHGAQVFALPVDEEGLDTARLPDGLLDVVVVTPSHQYPLGGSLPLSRRLELLEWATARGVVIVEDDYDSELRHGGSPLPTLAALDDPVDGVVLLLGTFSQTLTPALSSGYLLAPARLGAILEPVRRELGGPVSAVVQAALAEFLAAGELRRHTARMRRRYAVRRELVGERLAGLRGVSVRPVRGGLHAVIEFGDGAAARSIEERTVARLGDLGGAALGRYWQRRAGASGPSGLVIGMGGADTAEFERALVALRAILLEEATVPRA